MTTLREGPKYAHFTGDQTKDIQDGLDKKGPAVMVSQAFSLQEMRPKEGHSLGSPPRPHYTAFSQSRKAPATHWLRKRNVSSPHLSP